MLIFLLHFSPAMARGLHLSSGRFLSFTCKSHWSIWKESKINYSGFIIFFPPGFLMFTHSVNVSPGELGVSWQSWTLGWSGSVWVEVLRMSEESRHLQCCVLIQIPQSRELVVKWGTGGRFPSLQSQIWEANHFHLPIPFIFSKVPKMMGVLSVSQSDASSKNMFGWDSAHRGITTFWGVSVHIKPH